MEKTVYLVQACPMEKKDITRQSGEQTTLKVKEVVLSDGLDTFVAEAYDRVAEDLEDRPLETGRYYRVRCSLEANQVTNKDSGKQRYFNKIRLLSIR